MTEQQNHAHETAQRLLPVTALANDVREVLIEVGLCVGDKLSFDLTGTPFVLANGQLFKNGVETGLTVGLELHQDVSAHLHVTGVGASDSYAALLQSLQLSSTDAHDAARTVTLLMTDAQGTSRALTLIGSATLLSHTADESEIWTSGEARHDADTIVASATDNVLDLSDLLAGGTYKPGLSPVDHFIRVDHSTGDVFVDKTGGAYFHTGAVATLPAGSSLDTLNVILHDSEGARVVHSS